MSNNNHPGGEGPFNLCDARHADASFYCEDVIFLLR